MRRSRALLLSRDSHAEKYIVRLREEEREKCREVVRKLRGGSEKARRAQILLRADADGPGWTDRRIAEVYCCRRRTVENIRQRFVLEGFAAALERKRRATPPVANCSTASRRRKWFGHAHIPRRFGPLVDRFAREVLSPALNFHRPCMFPVERADDDGRIRKRYPHDAVTTPYERLKSLDGAERFLKPDVSFGISTRSPKPPAIWPPCAKSTAPATNCSAPSARHPTPRRSPDGGRASAEEIARR